MKNEAGGSVTKIRSGETLVIESGGTLQADSGATVSISDGSQAPGDLAVARGKIIVGNSSGVGAELDANDDGKILIGDGTDLNSVAVSGDVTITNAGVTAIGAAKVTSAMLAAGAGVAALLTAGLGGSASYLKTKNDTTTLVAAHATKDRAVLVVVVVDEIFANGSGGQPTFTVGETDTLNKFAPTSAFTSKAAGTVLVFAGTNTATKAISVTGVAATGTGTGGITVTVIAIPTT